MIDIDVEKKFESLIGRQRDVFKYLLESSYLDHAKFFLAYRERQPFREGRHHSLIAKTMQCVVDGVIKRLIINMPPSYTKTELCVIQFVSYGFTINPGCRFLHISGSETLALDNSSKIKDQVLSPIARELWGVSPKDDARAKGLWKTKEGGAFYAASSGGQILGFRAGRSKPGFQGALIIDDPQKEEDTRSPVKIKKFPDRYRGVIRHRVDNRDTPVIVVMQRLMGDDFSGFLLEGGSGEKWHHLCLSALIGDKLKSYSHAIPIEHNLKIGPLWEYKHTEKELKKLEKTDSHHYWAQYMQMPLKSDGTVFKSDWWQYYKVLPQFQWKAIFCDTAIKKGEHNSYTVFQCWAKWKGRIYLIDQFRDKILAVDLKQKLIEFWHKHAGTTSQPNCGCYIEDKASGSQLIQAIRRSGGIPVIAIPRNKSKIERANGLVNWIKSGLVYLPERADFLYDYKIEFERFSPLMLHKHDDQIDATLDAIEQMLIVSSDLELQINDGRKHKPISPKQTERAW